MWVRGENDLYRSRERSVPGAELLAACVPLKHWIHLRRSSRWPPTSNMLQETEDTRSPHRADTVPPLCCWRDRRTRVRSEKGIVHLLEVDFVHLELGLKDSRSQDAAAKQILKTKPGSVDLTKSNWDINNRPPGAEIPTSLERGLQVLCIPGH